MKLTRPVILFVLFGVGLGVVATDFAVAQPARPPLPGPGRGIAPGPPDIGPGPPDIGPRPPGVDPRPPGIGPHPPGVAPPPPAAAHRAPFVPPPGWPLKRPPRPVIARPPLGVPPVLVPTRLFLPPIVFGGVAVRVRNDRRYSHDGLVWQDRQTLSREDEWTEFTLDCKARGTKLWFEVLAGKLQVDWVEVVFDTGETQVVDFPDRPLGPGLYKLLDFREGRRVDHVRMVAKTTSREAKLTLWLER